MITERINQINARIDDIMELPMDDLIASMYMTEMERLIEERFKLERLITPFEERPVNKNHGLIGSKKLTHFQAIIILN